MSQMSTAGLVNGVLGPSCGFLLSRPPMEITLLEVVRLFEKVEEALMGHVSSRTRLVWT